MTENLPAVVQISLLDLEISDLTAKLKSPSSEEIARAILSMRRAGAAAPNGVEWDETAKVYEFALSDVPAASLKAVTRKFVTGEYENMDYRYIPRPPELAAMCRMEARTLHADLRRLNEKRATLDELVPREDRTDIAKIRRIHAEYKAWNAAQNAVAVVQEPMTDEKAEYWKKIQGLKDRKDLNLEETAATEAFRKLIQKQIDTKGE